MATITITKETFEQEVLKSDLPVLVDFWAAWCGPCKMLGPIIEKLSEEHPELKICKVNVDEQPELAEKYQVFSIPTVIAFKNGEQLEQNMGVAPPEKLLALLG